MFSGDRSSPARPCVRLLPREEKFFDLFVAVAYRNTEAARHLRELFEAPPERRTPHVEAIKRLEHEADQVTPEVVNPLAPTFTIPLHPAAITSITPHLDDQTATMAVST